MEIIFENNTYTEELIVSRDTRHGIKGFRVCRYTKETTDYDRWTWDETYCFYRTLDEVLIAFETGDYKQGRADF